MSSREIAELTGKPHSDLMKAIRAMEPAWEEIAGGKFSLGSYLDANQQERPQFELTKKECLYIGTKFNDVARAKLILRWEELETKSAQLDFNDPDVVLQLAQNWKEEQARRVAAEMEQKRLELLSHEQSEKLKVAAPKALFADAVATSDRSCLVGELAKVLKQNGIEMGQNRLFKWLRSKGYLGNKGEYYNQPTQRAMDLGLFEIKKTTINKPDGTVLISTTSKVTGKGQIYFVNKFLSSPVKV